MRLSLSLPCSQIKENYKIARTKFDPREHLHGLEGRASMDYRIRQPWMQAPCKSMQPSGVIEVNSMDPAALVVNATDPAAVDAVDVTMDLVPSEQLVLVEKGTNGSGSQQFGVEDEVQHQNHEQI